MTNAQQNELETKADQQRMDSPFEVDWLKKGKVNPMAGAARRKREPARLDVLTFPVLVDAETPDFRFKRLSRNPQFGSVT